MKDKNNHQLKAHNRNIDELLWIGLIFSYKGHCHLDSLKYNVLRVQTYTLKIQCILLLDLSAIFNC